MATPPNSEATIASTAQTLLRDTLHNTLHDLLIHRHREHKLLLATLDPTTKLPHCERCNLPRLLDPPLAPSVRGAASHPPSDTAYCERRPWCRKAGYDIYGNPFPKADLTGRPPTKKEREAAKKDGGKNEGTPASNEGGTAPPSPTPVDTNPSEKLEKGEKKASKIDEKLRKGEYIPWQTCPNCKRSLLITRFAKHLEQCMGLSGRQASRNAMAKMNGNGNTPAGSRGSTPVPEAGRMENGGSAEREDEDEDERVKGPGGVRKKVLKKGHLNSKLGKSSGLAKASSRENPTTANGRSSTSAVGTTTAENGKRAIASLLEDDADDDMEENVHVKKRQKLERVESTASLESSQSTTLPAGGAAGTSAVDMERVESQDADGGNDGSSFLGDEEEESGGDD